MVCYLYILKDVILEMVIGTDMIMISPGSLD